jgi:predicted acyl esterase
MSVRRTRLAAGLTAGALAVTGLALVAQPPAQAADTTPGYSVTPITVQVRTGPANDQPCTVSADIYKPDDVDATHRAPAILTTNGFGGSKDDSNEAAIGKGFVNQGYVVLAYSGLGFGSTTCKISLDDPQYDGKAGRGMVDVLAGSQGYTLDDGSGTTGRIGYVAQESAGDPRVGMIGGSYGGQIQYAVASLDPRVDAIVPIITWNDLSYSLAPNNTDLRSGVTYRTPGVAKKEWIDLFFGAGIASGAQSVTIDPETLVGCPNFRTEACTAAAQLNTAGYPDDTTLALARHASVSTYLRKITVPTLVVQGQKDTLFNLQEAVATYKSLQAQGTPTKMVWQSWGHSGSTPAPGELDFGAASIKDSYLGRRFLSWMDHYVRGNLAAPTGPEFAYFRDWVKYDTSPANAGTAVAGAYKSEGSFSDAPTATLYLSGVDSLTSSPDLVRPGSAQYVNAAGAPTSYSETSGLEGNQVNNPPSDAPGTYAGYTSAPLKAATSLVGSPRLSVRLSAPVAQGSQVTPGGKLVLFAKLYDVAPDGTKTLHNRLISPVRVGDVTKPVQVTLPAQVQRFAKGHRLQLVVAASDMAYAGNHVPQPVTIVTSKANPGTLRLPLTAPLTF